MVAYILLLFFPIHLILVLTKNYFKKFGRTKIIYTFASKSNNITLYFVIGLVLQVLCHSLFYVN